jgi:hypothetical protein
LAHSNSRLLDYVYIKNTGSVFQKDSPRDPARTQPVLQTRLKMDQIKRRRIVASICSVWKEIRTQCFGGVVGRLIYCKTLIFLKQTKPHRYSAYVLIFGTITLHPGGIRTRDLYSVGGRDDHHATPPVLWAE